MWDWNMENGEWRMEHARSRKKENSLRKKLLRGEVFRPDRWEMIANDNRSCGWV